jgi:uncharacterized caspase-like protein
MKNKYLLFILLMPLFFSASSIIKTEKRIALVIGNSNYDINDLDLKNPVNDADSMANVLSKEMGFEVITVKNGKKKEIRSALNRFDNQNRNIDKTRYNVVALFYYSGHGMRVNNINYIIPTDAYIQSPADLGEFAINSDWIVGRMEAQNNFLSLLMFDACRDNPLTKSMANYYKSINPTKSADYEPDRFAGFDKKELNGTGVFISYAAKAGETAGSGDLGGSTSPYISAYLTHVRTPNLPIETLFKKVGGEVVEKNKRNTTPYDEVFIL